MGVVKVRISIAEGTGRGDGQKSHVRILETVVAIQSREVFLQPTYD